MATEPRSSCVDGRESEHCHDKAIEVKNWINETIVAGSRVIVQFIPTEDEPPWKVIAVKQ
jgi:hypothetical protein